jgi:hypothetical protein
MYCKRTLYLGVPAVRKEPETAADTTRLEQERRWLTLAAHPGVVRLLPAATSPALWTRDVGERSLADLGTLEAPVVCGLGAAAATILADLHDLGIVHGAPCAEHLLIDTEGRPVLCSFGRASEANATGTRADVRILAATLLEALDAGAPRRLRRLLDRAAGPSRAPTARELARDLTRASSRPVLAPPSAPGPRATTPDATSTADQDPDPEPSDPLDVDTTDPLRSYPVRSDQESPADAAGREGPAPSGVVHQEPNRSPDGRTRTLRAVGALTATAALGALVALASPFGTVRHRATATPAAVSSRVAPNGPSLRPSDSTACPTVDVGCRPVPLHDGLFVVGGERWRLSEPSDVVAVGRWTCAGALPAALDPHSGQVWVFRTWTTRTATAVAIVPGATSLSAAPRRSGCDLIAVTRGNAPILLLDPLPELTSHG